MRGDTTRRERRTRERQEMRKSLTLNGQREKKCDRKEKRERHEIKKNNIKRYRKHEKLENAGGRETLEIKETMKFTVARKSRLVK